MTDFRACKRALDLEKEGDWKKAHDIVESLHSSIAAHVHAYLHRVEGDQWNADYWYRRAGVPRIDNTLDEEWDRINDLIMRALN